MFNSLTSTNLRFVFALDRNVVRHMAVALLSVCEVHKDIPIEVLLILIDVPREDVVKIQMLANQYPNLTMHYVPYLIENPERFPVKQGHISVAAYARVFIAELLPESWTKVVYLDCDVIVRRCFQEVWNFDIAGLAGAAVQEPGTARHRALGMDESLPYFNSGVMLINLSFWREHNVKQLLLEYICRYPDRLLFWDQDAINACLSRKMRRLPRCWNVTHIYYIGPYRDLDGMRARELLNLQKDPGVVHFTGPTKPWMYIMTHPFQDTYWQLLRRTPFRDAEKESVTARTFLFRHMRIVHRYVKRTLFMAFSLLSERTLGFRSNAG